MTEKFHMIPMGYSTVRPKVALPSIDRATLMGNVHLIAKRYRPYVTPKHSPTASKRRGNRSRSPVRSPC
jgi:hypothetical protein